jgi:hypothetical protein
MYLSCEVTSRKINLAKPFQIEKSHMLVRDEKMSA